MRHPAFVHANDLRNDLEYQLAADIAALGRRMVALDSSISHALSFNEMERARDLAQLREDAREHRSDLMLEAFAWRQRQARRRAS